MIRKTILLKLISWVVFSPTFAIAGQLHCRADVRETMQKAWMATANGRDVFEAAFFIREDGSIDYRGTTREYLTMHLGKIPSGTVAIFHTHPNQGVAELSRADKKVADDNGLVIYAITNRGLFQYSHPRGEVLLRPDMEWEKACQ